MTLPPPAAGELLVRNLFMSVDPYMRGRMVDRKSYAPPFQLDEPMQGGAVGEVIESADPAFAPGDRVHSIYGWREAVVAPAADFTRLPTIAGVPPQAFLGILGMPGLTAWGGLTQIGEPKPGDTVLVSGAAGAVGSAVAQIAKLRGCTVIGTAGSDAKCQWLRDAGIDHAINYRTTPSLLQAVRAAAPDGIDIYFDNVGGEHLEAALDVARPGARLVECGMIANYNLREPAPGPRNIILVVTKTLKMQGFLVYQFEPLRQQFLDEVGPWVAERRILHAETVMEGIESAPQAFIGLFSGANTGKMLVKL